MELSPDFHFSRCRPLSTRLCSRSRR